MVTLAQALAFLYPNARPLVDLTVIDDGTGQVISLWNEATLGPQPTAQQIEAAKPLAAKHFAIAANRAEARRRIEAKWPDPIQRSAAMGVYPADKIEQMKLDIAAVIEAENTAADQIDAATTVQQVEAVTPAWPNI